MKSFPGATIEEMFDCIKTLLRKCLKNTILHIETNNTITKRSRTVLDKLLSLKAFVERALPDSKICISNFTLRTDNAKASLTVNNVNQDLATLQLDIIDNSNISNSELSRGGGYIWNVKPWVHWILILLKKSFWEVMTRSRQFS